MRKEILELSQMDPDVLAAQRAVRTLMKAIKWNMDPLLRNVIDVQGEEAMAFEKWVQTRSGGQKIDSDTSCSQESGNK